METQPVEGGLKLSSKKRNFYLSKRKFGVSPSSLSTLSSLAALASRVSRACLNSLASFISLSSLNISLRLKLIVLEISSKFQRSKKVKMISNRISSGLTSERGDVPGWVLVVLMTTGLVTAIWTIAAPRLTSILKNSLDAMNGIR